MKKITSTLIGASLVAGFIIGGIALAADGPVITAPGQNKLLCFDGTTDTATAVPEGSYGPYGGVCTLKTNGAKGSATLDNSVLVGSADYSGVYIPNSTLNGKSLAQITQLSFNYTGTSTNGSPRLTLPIDTNGDTITDDYLSISAYWCNNEAGTVDAIHDPTCTIFVNSDGTTPVGMNWAGLVVAHPTWTVTDDYAFLIADDAGLWTVNNVKLGKGGK